MSSTVAVKLLSMPVLNRFLTQITRRPGPLAVNNAILGGMVNFIGLTCVRRCRFQDVAHQTIKIVAIGIDARSVVKARPIAVADWLGEDQSFRPLPDA